MQPDFAWTPSDAVIAATRLKAFMGLHGLRDYDHLLARSNDDPEWFWAAIYRFFEIAFIREPDHVVDLSRGIEWPRWCPGGRTNIVSHCLDRHRGTPAWDKTAIIGEAEDGTHVALTYAELAARTDDMAAVLRAAGIKQGDVVALYLPMIPESAVAFFAVLKLGAIILPLFSGFGPQPIAQRIGHAGARAIITTSHAWRRGAKVELLANVRQALLSANLNPAVIVLDRGEPVDGGSVVWRPGQAGQSRFETEQVAADAPAMLMYTSGTTGAPKGTVHTHCGMLAKNALDMGLCVDMRADDRLLWMSDMGWIAGPKMILSAALLGATLVMAEGTPTWPRSGRLFEIMAKHRITMLGLVPTIVRQVMRTDPDAGRQHDLSALRITVSAGEPWTDDAWWWFFDEICGRRTPILNYAGGTECGGAVLVGTPLHPSRPGSFGGPVPGCGGDIVDADGHGVPPNVIGELVMRGPSIGQTQGLWHDDARYLESYWSQIPGMWVQGDLASRDEDGLWYLHGRSDDVIKIAGKRTGPSEIEAAALATGLVRDCFVVGVPDAVKGSALVCAYIPAAGHGSSDVPGTISKAIAEQCGSAYRPQHFLQVEDLPRTRNEKRMRRVVRSIMLDQPLGDVSSCVNPESIDQIRSAQRTQRQAV